MDETFLINSKKQFHNMWQHSKIATGQGDDYATGCLLDYN